MGDRPRSHADHSRHTLDAYNRLAPVWSESTDDGPFNGWLERPAFRALVPETLKGATVLDAGCGSGAQAEWLLDRGANVVGIDLSPAMIEEARRRCRGRGRFLVGDLAEPLPVETGSIDGITCSLTLHYIEDWMVPLRSFGDLLKARGWLVLSLGHPSAPPFGSQRGSYFDSELVSDTWIKGSVEVTQHVWRRPLSAMVDAFAEAGFLVERIAESRPSPQALERYPEDLAWATQAPSFIIFRLLRVR